jgi:hypothetical protein
MSETRAVPANLRSSTITLAPDLLRLVESLQPGQRIRITQKVRVGCTAEWTFPVEGVFRHVNYLVTGLATDRVPEDDIVVIAVHFTKDNGELSSITVDQNTTIEVVAR